MMKNKKGIDKSDPTVVTLCLLVEGSKVGGIIGKGGARINAMREDANVTVKIQGDVQDVEQLVSICGPLKDVAKTIHTIAQYDEESSNSGRNQDISKSPASINMVVPSNQCGAIIGSGGYRIKEIRQNTNCLIKIGRECLPESTEKLLTLTSTPEVIQDAIEKIGEVIISEGAVLTNRSIGYIPVAFGPSAIFGNHEDDYGTWREPFGDYHGQRGMNYGYGGGPVASSRKIEPRYDPYGRFPDEFPPPRRGYNPQFDQFEDDDVNYDDADGEIMGPYGPIDPIEILSDTDCSFFTNKISRIILPDGMTEFHIKNNMMGSVIGQRGAVIKEIRALSTPDIKIYDQEEGNDFRKIHVDGDEDVIERINLLIHICVNVYHEERHTIENMNLLQAIQHAHHTSRDKQPEAQKERFQMPFTKLQREMPFSGRSRAPPADYGSPSGRGKFGLTKKSFPERNTPYGIRSNAMPKRGRWPKF